MYLRVVYVLSVSGSNHIHSGDKTLLGFDRAEISPSLPSSVAQWVSLTQISVPCTSAGCFVPCRFWCRVQVLVLFLAMFGVAGGEQQKKMILFLFLIIWNNVTILIACFNFSFFIFFVLKFCISKAGSLSFRTLKLVSVIAFPFNVEEWNWGGKTNLSRRKFSVI